MSQHNIVGSEAFKRAPFVIVRSFRPGGMRRRRARTAMAFVAGAVAALAVGAVTVAAVLGPNIVG